MGRFRIDELAINNFPYQTLQWMHSPRKCLTFGPDICQYCDRYSICVYYGTEEDILHRIVRQYNGFKFIDVSFHNIQMRQGMNIDEFFIPDGYWQTIEPYKSKFDEYIVKEKQKKQKSMSNVHIPIKKTTRKDFDFSVYIYAQV